MSSIEACADSRLYHQTSIVRAGYQINLLHGYFNNSNVEYLVLFEFQPEITRPPRILHEFTFLYSNISVLIVLLKRRCIIKLQS